MKAMKGNTSNLATFSKLFNKFSNFYESHQINRCENSNLLRIRFFSSFDGHNRSRQGRRNGRNDYNDDDDEDNNNNNRNDKFSGRNRGNFGNQGFNPNAGRPARGDRQRAQFGGQNAGNDPDYRGRGRRNDGFSKPMIGGDKGRANFKLSDDVLKFDDNGEGSGDVGSDYQPSVRELINRPVRGEQRGGKEGDEFLEKFKLGGVSKEESRSDEVRSNATLSEEKEKEKEKLEVSEDADEIFNKMKKSGLIPNAVAMLDGLCKDGLVHEAMKLFGVMRERGTMPEVVVYTAVVEGFCQAQKFDDAKRIFKKMQDNGIVPNAFSYTVLVKGLCKGKRLEEAVDFCVEMLEAGHSPNVPTFTDLVHEFCKEKGIDDAQKVILSLKQKGFFLDEKAVRVYLDKSGPTSPMVWEAIFGPKKTTHGAI
ncbi:hypothetical protein RND81_11G160300 [Saponaria officinalis]|uniref:Pentatricopeptide repeat-containing protein n=1 Tax=Saponaria officinalis TaxID=3572 RepID=A0AAW1HMT8_SAPOF